MQKRTIIIYLILSLLPISCNTSKQEVDDEMPLLYPHPLTAKFNPEGGYTINPVTGDSIQPVINSYGDTLKTGVNLSVRGQLIDPGNSPLMIPASKPEIVPIPQEVHKVPEDITVIPVNKDSLRSYVLGKESIFPIFWLILRVIPYPLGYQYL